MSTTYRVRIKERDYVLWPSQTPETLAVHLVAVDSLEYWSNAFDSNYIGEITSKAGSRRDLATFACMLQTALEGQTRTVSLDLLTTADLQRLQTGRAQQAPALASRVFLILSFCTEFDRCHFPLPLDTQRPQSPVHAFRVGVAAILRDVDKRAGLAERASMDVSAQLARTREALAEAREEAQRAQGLAADAERRAHEAEESNAKLQTALRRVLARVESERAERAHRELVNERIQQRATEAAIQRAAEELVARRGGQAEAGTRKVKRVKRVKRARLGSARGGDRGDTRDCSRSVSRGSTSPGYCESSAVERSGSPGTWGGRGGAWGEGSSISSSSSNKGTRRQQQQQQRTPVGKDRTGRTTRSLPGSSRRSSSVSSNNSNSSSSTPPGPRQRQRQRELTPTVRAPSPSRGSNRPHSLQPLDISPEMEQIDRRLNELKGIIQTAMQT